MSGLIPIKLAEQAMANLEAELADLKSTADRFEVENSILMKETSRLLAENERLKAENDRLRKAGDLLAFHISLGRKFLPNDPIALSITDWNAAKDGMPSV